MGSERKQLIGVPERSASHLVIWDGDGDYWEGSVVDLARARTLYTKGVALTPVDPSLFNRNPVAGYHKRSWGAGWPLESPTSKLVSPMILFVVPNMLSINWRARLVAEGEYKAKLESGEVQTNGTLRLVTHSGMSQIAAGGLATGEESMVDLSKLGPCDKWNGWTIGGRATLNVNMDVYYGFALYGAAAGLRLVWSSVSQSD